MVSHRGRHSRGTGSQTTATTIGSTGAAVPTQTTSTMEGALPVAASEPVEAGLNGSTVTPGSGSTGTLAAVLEAAPDPETAAGVAPRDHHDDRVHGDVGCLPRTCRPIWRHDPAWRRADVTGAGLGWG